MEKPQRFDDLPLSGEVLDALRDMGFEKPTDIQRETIPLLLEGRDVIGQAQTGTGKTASFGIPLAERIDASRRKTSALILVPTRELAEQVAGEINEIGQFNGVHAVAVYGGASFGPQIRAFKDGVPIVVGTPGRVMDHMRRKNLRLDDVQFFGLDEADRMLDMGFIEDIQWVLGRVPRNAQKFLFSATMPNAILELSKAMMRNPANVHVSEDKLTVEGTEQIYYNVGYRNKPWALARVIEAEEPELAFVFCRTKSEVDKVTKLLKSHGYKAKALHGDFSQGVRNKVMDQARDGKINIIVATDVLARGIDVSHCTHVINYDVPDDPEWYVHRIGRTGRMGKTGKAITFVTSEERRALLDLHDVSGGRLKFEEIPDPDHLQKDKIKKVMDWKELASPTGMVTFRLNIGRADDARMIDVFKAVNKACGFREATLGLVNVGEEETTLEVPFELAGRFYGKFQNGELLGKKVTAEVYEDEDELVI